MPVIRNSSLIKRFTDYFKLKIGDGLDSEVSPLIVPTINQPLPVNIEQISDLSLNNSNKTFIVPSGKQWRLLFGHIAFTTTATVGSRKITFILEDAEENDLFLIHASGGQIASLTNFYSFQTSSNLQAIGPDLFLIPIPGRTILPENFRIHILDSKSVDPAADDLIVRFIVEETDMTGE